MIVIRNTSTLEKHTMYPATLCSFCHEIFSLDISGHFKRFPCNHSYGYAHNVMLGRIVQTDSLTKRINMLPIVCIPIKYSG